MTPAEERRALLGDAAIERIRALVKAAPPLTDEQRAIIAGAFRRKAPQK
ncbi:hypothetical protein ACQ86B_13635 [Mycolicibacterium aichiense]